MKTPTIHAILHRGRTGALCLLVGGASALLAACGSPSSPGIAGLGTNPTTTSPSSSGAGGVPTSPPGSPRGRGGGTGISSTQMVMGGATVAYSQCMRQHGVPSFPDPNSQGSVSVTNNAGVSATVFQSASQSCSKYMKKGARPTPAQIAQSQAQALAFSRCMRAHGLPTFPDPTFHANGSMSLGMQAGGSLDPNSPIFQHAQSVCQSLQPHGGKGGPPSLSSGGNG